MYDSTAAQMPLQMIVICERNFEIIVISGTLSETLLLDKTGSSFIICLLLLCMVECQIPDLTCLGSLIYFWSSLVLALSSPKKVIKLSFDILVLPLLSCKEIGGWIY